MPGIFRTNARAVTYLAFVATLLAGFYLLELSPLPSWRVPESQSSHAGDTTISFNPEIPPCQRLAGLGDVVVVMRTGATEIKDKLPIHFNTTFRCYPDTLIFSDYAEVFQGHQVFDVLASVDDNLKRSNADFQHYLRLQRLGREGLAAEELHAESYESGPVGKNDNPGWRLDKWKFLPMIVESLKLRPEKRWFVYVEPDTYIVWSNLVRWLTKLDPSKEAYYGSEVQIGSDVFAHGGTGFVMSAPAMRKAADLYLSEPNEWHARTSGHWAGDCILGTALKKAGVDLTWSWPMFQGGNPAELKWMENKNDQPLWCAPAISYHHFTSHEVESMWGFEQQHIIRSMPKAKLESFWTREDKILHHQDMFRQYVLPNITADREDWSNLSPDLVPYSNRKGLSLGGCRALCEAKEECLQYALGPIGCSLGSLPMMGSRVEGIKSGWMLERIEHWMRNMKDCRGKTDWTVT
ncbi:hypothetical protein LTR08_001795 [Meristemomyces frigidus]|nr:hypothetical protein LTR08_001795 [Meristemomyces frigidus]